MLRTEVSKMNTTLKNLLEFADLIGVVDQMLCYDRGFSTVEGKTRDGKKFSVTLRIEEEDKDGN